MLRTSAPGDRTPKRSAKLMAVVARFAVIVLLTACAWYVWVKEPQRPDARVAAQFCKGIAPGTPAAGIMQAASEAGATGFSAPRADELVVAFGHSTCSLSLHGGVFSGKPTTSSAEPPPGG